MQPDVSVAADKAVKTAHLMALKKVAGRTADPMLKQRFEQLAAEMDRELK